MPKPRKDERRSEFIGRCMSDDKARRDFPSRSQRFAFCQSTWEQSRKKTKADDEEETQDECETSVAQ